MKFFAIIFLTFVSLAVCAQDPPPGVDPGAGQEIFRLVNLERARAGLPSLRWDTSLEKAARAHSRIMADAHQLSHEFGAEPPFDKRLVLAGASFNLSGENVAFNQTADGAHRALMTSPPHRKNILNPDFNSIGIGVVRVGDDIWVTQDFAREFPQQSPLEARNQVIAAFQQARRDARLRPVAVTDEPRLQALVCRMARQGELDTRTPLAWSTVRSTVAYTDADLAHLPSTAMTLATDPTVERISVAVCFGKSSKYESGMNWVSIAAY